MTRMVVPYLISSLQHSKSIYSHPNFYVSSNLSLSLYLLSKSILMAKSIQMGNQKTPFLLFIPLLFLFSILSIDAFTEKRIGINYGQLGNDLPSPSQSIEIIKNMKAGMVKIYDANPEILRALSGTKIKVSIMLTNDQISKIASSQALADQWVRDNVFAYYPNTLIRFILVGNEVLSYNTTQDLQIWRDLVPAMRRIKNFLKTQNIKNIKVGTPLAIDVLKSTFPPSSGRFRDDVLVEVIVPLLNFLNQTSSYFFIDAYTYFPWSANPTNMSLDYALLSSENETFIDPLTKLEYTNLLDQMLDSLIYAMSNLGFSNIKLAIAETGWPNGGDVDQLGANIQNAAIYNRNLVKRMTTQPPLGTPARPGVQIPTFIFSLYDENQKTGPGTERHWGLLHPNGTRVYDLDLTGQSPKSSTPLPGPTNNKPYKGNIWCVVADGANLEDVQRALHYACDLGDGLCDALAPGKECYEPVSVVDHANYAFSSFWAKFRGNGATCHFSGVATQTTKDPSRGSCKFPSVLM